MRISDWSSDVCSSDLLDLLRPLGLARGVRLFLRFIFEFADVQELAYRRIGIGRDLDQVEPDLGRRFNRFGSQHNAQIFAFSVDYADLGRSEEHTSAPVTNAHLVCRLLLEKK